jgi:hypothetical protein
MALLASSTLPSLAAAPNDTKYVEACLTAVAPTLAVDEAIVAITKGQTRYSRQTFLYYKVDIATFVSQTGNSPTNPRTIYVAVNVDTPDPATFASSTEWQPLVWP